ncbi:hypothetical protein V2P20_01420 [Methylobacter sp. Wu1]|uniref:hypothetical protein n=1 Tax=Methylobacter sp. Wu1 TaxID=3119359 RepID=UPI002F921998
MDITRTVREHFPHFDPQHQFGFRPVLEQGIVFLDESVAVQAKTGLSLKIDE